MKPSCGRIWWCPISPAPHRLPSMQPVRPRRCRRRFRCRASAERSRSCRVRCRKRVRRASRSARRCRRRPGRGSACAAPRRAARSTSRSSDCSARRRVAASMLPGEPMPMPAAFEPASFSAARDLRSDRVDDRVEGEVFEVLLVLGMNRAVVRDDRRGHVRSAEIHADCRTHGSFMFGAATGRTRTAGESTDAWRPSTSSPCGTLRAARASRRIRNCSTRGRSNTSIRSRSTRNTSRSSSTKRRRATTTPTRSRSESGRISITTIRSSSKRSRKVIDLARKHLKDMPDNIACPPGCAECCSGYEPFVSRADVQRIADHFGVTYGDAHTRLRRRASIRRRILRRLAAQGWRRPRRQVRLPHGVAQRPLLLRHLRGAARRLPRVYADRLRRRRRLAAAQDRVEDRRRRSHPNAAASETEDACSRWRVWALARCVSCFARRERFPERARSRARISCAATGASSAAPRCSSVGVPRGLTRASVEGSRRRRTRRMALTQRRSQRRDGRLLLARRRVRRRFSRDVPNAHRRLLPPV